MSSSLSRRAVPVTGISAFVVAASVTACFAQTGDGHPAWAENAHIRPRDPIIFVHGCPPPFGNAEQGAQFFNPLIDLFKARGYPEQYLYRFVFSGPQCASTLDHATELADLVNEVRHATGASRVDIVAHSMGALATRLYIRRGGHRYVRDFVSIAGGNHGTDTAVQGMSLQAKFGYPAYEGMKEMYPPYACEDESFRGATHVQSVVNGCLTPSGRTKSRDETPGRQTHYLSIWNSADELVFPREAACLEQAFQNDCSSSVNVQMTVPPGSGPCAPGGATGVCPGHVAMLWDADVMRTIVDFVADCRTGDRRSRHHQSGNDN